MPEPRVHTWNAASDCHSRSRTSLLGVRTVVTSDPLPDKLRGELPGSDLIRQGLEDLRAGLTTVPALLVSIGAPRLRRIGMVVPHALDDPEHRLYELLQREDSRNAHSRYNALVRRLVSFERAAECAT